MKRLISIIIIALALISCSEDKPTAPADEINGAGIVASANIGSEGGTISSDGIRIDIPPGAFSETQSLAIYSVDSSLFDEGIVTETFRLEGFPTRISKPLRISIKYNGNLDEESLIIFSDVVYDELFDENITIYEESEAVDSSGFLVGFIPGERDGNNIN
ncbi:MAG: hypothetical protein R3250_10720, partial [Melioribacteraceae bacterium]|nr:hypothetical protein [Melioribacteraceae bacterium]